MNVVTWSAVDYGHVPFVMALTGGRREVVQPFDLLGAQLDAVGHGILLDAGNPLGAGNRSDVVALSRAARPERSVPVLLRLPGRRLGPRRRCADCAGSFRR